MTHSSSLAMQHYSIEVITRNMLKDMDFCHSREIWNTATKTEKSASE